MTLSDLKSKNFEFLRTQREELASLGAFAEAYASSDPASALVKLRGFAEQIVNSIYRDLALPRPYQTDLIQLLSNDSFKAVVPPVVLDKFHILRVRGNKAAHGQAIESSLAMELVRDAFDLARWFAVTFLGVKVDALPSFVSVYSQDAERMMLGKEQLVAHEARIYDLLKELES